jgi:pyridine nucleotide-disulfide oxidoreductase family protein
MSSQLPNLVLIGGGHSHTVAMKTWNQKTFDGLRSAIGHRPIANLSLITPTSKTVYSGSVPGYLSGHWERAGCELETVQLAQRSGITTLLDEVIGLDLEQKRVICRNTEPIPFDIASINIGCTPKLPLDVVAIDRIIPMKPMDQMLDRLSKHLNSNQLLSVAIVGGGLGGIEVALSLKARWGEKLDLVLICRHELASHQNKALQHFFKTELEQRSIRLHLNTTVLSASEDSQGITLQLNSGHTDYYDISLWATEATAPDWLRTSGLAVDDQGFVLVDDSLRSISHPNLFASGDIACHPNAPLPKAGVFAVRQGKTIAQNLTRSFSHQSLKPFKTPTQYLSLVSLGDRRAVMSYGRTSISQPSLQKWLWSWKRSIDDAFVRSCNP